MKEIYLRAYPDYIVKVTDSSIIWKDGTEMHLGDLKERTFQDKLNSPSLLDQISIPYILGLTGIENARNNDYDPGRLRYIPLFQKMYGTIKEEVENNLTYVEWLPKSLKKKNHDGSFETYKIPVTKVNNVAGKVKKISEELDSLPDEYKKFLEDPGGTFCWRLIAGTDRPSAHSFGMTIDINVPYSNYWLWDYKKALGISQETSVSESDIERSKFPAYHNQIPLKIVEIFEKYDFIWGGKWNHYDTMHFEYRPELFPEHFLDKVDSSIIGNALD